MGELDLDSSGSYKRSRGIRKQQSQDTENEFMLALEFDFAGGFRQEFYDKYIFDITQFLDIKNKLLGFDFENKEYSDYEQNSLY
jgi:hypothetical protein